MDKFDRKEWLEGFEDVYADGGYYEDFLPMLTLLFERIEAAEVDDAEMQEGEWVGDEGAR